MRLRVISAAVLFGLLGWVSVALAAGNGSSASAYGGTEQKVAGTLASSPKGGGSTLPFTGLNLTLLVLAGLALVAVGFMMRRVSRNRA